MISQASLVVSAVVEAVNNGPVIPEPKVSRSSSYLVMPPPPAKKRPTASDHASISGLEMLSQAAAGISGGSPPKMSHAAVDMRQDDSCVLVSDDEDQVLSHLSPEQCASIVDGVFRELDDDFCLGPPAKRFKETGSPRSTRNECTGFEQKDD
jgi:hypothetical protein